MVVMMWVIKLIKTTIDILINFQLQLHLQEFSVEMKTRKAICERLRLKLYEHKKALGKSSQPLQMDLTNDHWWFATQYF